MAAETHDSVSTIASRLLRINQNDVIRATANAGDLATLLDEIHKVAASALRQDETKGQDGGSDPLRHVEPK